MSNLFLIGFMGVGKTTVGPLVAGRLGWRFVDADAQIEAQAGNTIDEIFAREGEAPFRRLETEVLARLGQLERHVVAVGGGAPAVADNWTHLRRGLSVYLALPLSPLLARLEGASRPLLAGLGAEERARRVADLLRQRLPHYRRADLTVSAAGTPEQVAYAVVAATRLLEASCKSST